MKEWLLQLTALELIFFITTIISIFINLFQFMIWWRDKKNVQRPLSNSLLALFNDIKAKSTNVYATQKLLWHSKNPHSDIQTLRWEYHNTLQAVHAYLSGFQEAVVGLLVSLNPEDREGQEAFRASEYGLTEAEKEQKAQQLSSLQQQMQSSAPDHTTQGKTELSYERGT